MKYFRNIPLLIFAIIAVLMIILAIVDKMFSLGWGHEWKHILYLLGFLLGAFVLYIFGEILDRIGSHKGK
jgi:hypothetical protein